MADRRDLTSDQFDGPYDGCFDGSFDDDDYARKGGSRSSGGSRGKSNADTNAKADQWRASARGGTGRSGSGSPLFINGVQVRDRETYRLPTSPFGRLGLTHAACAAGDTFVTIALAKTLFFVSPDQARSSVILYLALTLAPFAVVSPFIGPLIDRFAANRGIVITLSAVLRGALCLLLSGDYAGPGLFPEAFALLVVSKGYAIARSSLVPAVVPNPDELVLANSRLSLIAGLAGFAAAIPGGLLSLIGPRWVLSVGALVFFTAAYFGSRLRVPVATLLNPDGPLGSGRSTGGRSATSLSAKVSADRAGNRFGNRASSRSNSAPNSGKSSKSSATTRSGIPTFGSAMRTQRAERAERLEALDNDRRRALELRLATVAMSVQRLLVGLVTFLAAFSLKRENAATVWLGVMGAAGVLGGLLGSLVAPKLGRRVNEITTLLASMIAVCGASAVAAVIASRPSAAVAVFIVGMSAGVSRLAFDALVQRDGVEELRGASFAKLETRFQLTWVLGALFPVVAEASRPVGFGVMTAVSGLALAVLIGGEASLKRIDAALSVGSSLWHRPKQPTEADWLNTEDENYN
jgi:MFS family permease